ncbi:hypothetical protein F0562_029627 [Nyssa sinensis]|uniref:DUF1639 domain-containing protein n=1 Tax=Nyssa sinensis TaxID=561372 RepID=A0A5J5B5T1_9ASTE|nr:hypothetical protein F0562_029627 [Nyssa sinensis]
MMRYQRVSPDGLPLTNGRRSSSSGDNSKRIIPTFEGKGLPRFSSPSRNQDQNFSHFDGGGSVSSSPPQSENHHHHHHQYTTTPPRNNSPSPSPSPSRGGGDVLLQWGHKKRSRCSRTETRVVAVATDESSSSIHFQSKQATKVQRRVTQPSPSPAPGVDKLSTTMPPPPLPSARPNGKKSSGIFPTRNSEERCGGGGNGSPPSGSSGRVVSHRSTVRKRSPCLEEASAKDDKLLNGVQLRAADDCSPLESEPQACSNVNGTISIAAAAAEREKVNGDVVEWPRIYIPLTRKEKEDDFLSMKGTKLPHRPKKRAKAIDRVLQYCFPGMWLSDVTRARYEVREKKRAKKQKPRGLKGMESMDSDSE